RKPLAAGRASRTGPARSTSTCSTSPGSSAAHPTRCSPTRAWSDAASCSLRSPRSRRPGRIPSPAGGFGICSPPCRGGRPSGSFLPGLEVFSPVLLHRQFLDQALRRRGVRDEALEEADSLGLLFRVALVERLGEKHAVREVALADLQRQAQVLQ